MRGLLALLALLASPLHAQEADSVAVASPPLPTDSAAVADTLRATSAVADSTEAPDAPPRIPLSAYVSPAGVTAGPVPATQPALTVVPLLAAAHADADAAFVYDLGEPGWLPGLGLAGRAPRRATLTLDGAPMADLVSGRPRYDLLPLDLLGRLSREPVALGAPAGTHATVRSLNAPVARTELRYVTGQEGVQFIGATHAQTRRPDFVGRDGRLGILFHVAGVGANGTYGGSDLGGYRVLARATLNRPRWALAVTEYRTRIEAGARGAVTADAAVYNPFAATVADETATRVDLVHLLSARLRLATGILPVPTAVTAFRLAQTARYTPSAGIGTTTDDYQVEAQHWGVALVQPLPLGTHGITLRVTAWRDAALDSTSASFMPTSEARSFAHLALTDSTTLGAAALQLGVGLDVTPEGTFASGYAEMERAVGFLWLDAQVRYGGGGYGRAEVGGYAPDSTGGVALQADGLVGDERTTQGSLGIRLDAGSLRLGLRATGVLQHDTRLLLANTGGPDESGATFATLPGTLQRAIGTVTLAFRPDARRGLYATTTASAQQGTYTGDGSTSVAVRALAALPDAWGQAQVGFRALGVFDGVLDLDIALRGRAWASFSSRAYHPPSGLFPIPDAAAVAAPTSGTLGLVVLTRLQKRASLYLVYENALAERAYAGTYVVPVYPITPHHLRFGVFWTLFG
ncbi:MAG: hypothetical protein AAF624_03385 [Bacteroidota bacterium]